MKKLSKNYLKCCVIFSKSVLTLLGCIVDMIIPAAVYILYTFSNPTSFWQKIFFLGIVGFAVIAEIISIGLTVHCVKEGWKEADQEYDRQLKQHSLIS